MLWLVPDYLVSYFPSHFSHGECDSPRDSQPFLSFPRVIEIEPVASCGPCHTVHLSPDRHEGFNVFLHGPFASDFVDGVSDVPTSAVVRRARDGAIHGITDHRPEYFSGVPEQKPALPAGEDGRYHARRNHGRTHTLFAARETRIGHGGSPSVFVTRFRRRSRSITRGPNGPPPFLFWGTSASPFDGTEERLG